MQIKIKILTLFLIYAFIGNKLSIAQQFADKQFYLLDSLDVNVINQNDRLIIDSLLGEYHKSKSDTTKLNQLTVLISNCEDDVWIRYNYFLKEKAEDLFNSTGDINFKTFIASGYNNLGFYYFQLDKSEEAIKNFELAIKLSKEANDIKVIPTALNNIGYIYKQQGNILKALTYYHESLKLNKQLKDETEVALCLNNIGSIYYAEKEYDKALKYYREALIIEKKIGSKKAEGRLYSNIGATYKGQGNIQTAIEYFDHSLKIYREINYERGIAFSQTKKAELELTLSERDNDFLNLSDIEQRLMQSKTIFEKTEDNEGLVFTLYNLSRVNLLQGNIEQANLYGQQSLIVSKKIGYPASIKDAAKVLQDISLAKNDYKRAFLMQKLFYKMQDSISNQSTREGIIQKQYEYEYDKKVISDSLQAREVQKIKDLKYSQEIEQQKMFTYVGVFGLILMGIIALIVLRGNRIKKKANLILADKNKVIEEKSNEITDSINYAKRIQQAIIPPKEEVNRNLKEAFVFYQPKDIVAGDFYWLQQIDDVVLYAAADCTGHGVPGALVSVVCNNALNRAVREYNLMDPAAILNKAKEIIIETFQRSKNKEFTIKDGMDIALCTINFNNLELKYAGANNPLYVINKNRAAWDFDGNVIGEQAEGLEIKPDKQPVAIHFNDKPFTTHTIKLQKGDNIYTFSDGYADQFGGPKGKKFMYKRFKNLLVSISELSMEEQKVVLEKEFYQWKGDLDQIDDVCVMGVKI